MLRIYLTLTYFLRIIVLKIRITQLSLRLEEKMSEIEIIKEIDGVGRGVIPKELRERYGLSGDVEVVATENGVLIKSREYILIKKSQQ